LVEGQALIMKGGVHKLGEKLLKLEGKSNTSYGEGHWKRGPV